MDIMTTENLLKQAGLESITQAVQSTIRHAFWTKIFRKYHDEILKDYDWWHAYNYRGQWFDLNVWYEEDTGYWKVDVYPTRQRDNDYLETIDVWKTIISVPDSMMMKTVIKYQITQYIYFILLTTSIVTVVLYLTGAFN